MDASADEDINLQEEVDVSYRSKFDGKMHACKFLD